MNSDNSIILGGGITGLAAGVVSGYAVYEKKEIPGGLCASYYLTSGGTRTYERVSGDSYRFEIGGGHWIFGATGPVERFLRNFAICREYKRSSGVLLSRFNKIIPYPLQYHLSYFPEDVQTRILKEINERHEHPAKKPVTLAEWLEGTFGPTLYELFFGPFHALYTDGLFTRVACSDTYKSPFDKSLIAREARPSEEIGYNTRFLYPEAGLDALISSMASRCDILYNKEAVRIDAKRKRVHFSDGTSRGYERLISTLPLHHTLYLCRADLNEPFAYTSVLVVNVGAQKGRTYPKEHWVYMPHTRSGFHRVGFYSNVDASFLPARASSTTGSLYIEKAFTGGTALSMDERQHIARSMIDEVTEMEFISSVDVYDVTWIDVGYTWNYPGSSWRERAIALLQEQDIFPLGRYGLWQFQGLAQSVEEGMNVVEKMQGARVCERT
ncbi:MAG: protoporphyrinogen oxidase-like protein [Candidatus Omnitrophica bacterium]|nr:protoporphyrinogen oxidase-like protein [Candidatus Omnitrophota bacterium]